MKFDRTYGESGFRLWFGEPYESGFAKVVYYKSCTLLGLRFFAGGEDQVLNCSISLAFRTLSFSLAVMAWRWRLPDWGRETSISLQWHPELQPSLLWDVLLHLEIWRDDSSWSCDDHKRWPWQGNGWHWMYYPLRWIVGDYITTRQPWLEEKDVVLVMPEGRYKAKLSVDQVERRRPRWPFGVVRGFASDLRVDGGVPIPGKGENSYDCADDAIYSSGRWYDASERIDEQVVLSDFAFSTLKRRVRYGSIDWKPSSGKWPSHVDRRAQ